MTGLDGLDTRRDEERRETRREEMTRDVDETR
jgi:hypothetical protein